VHANAAVKSAVSAGETFFFWRVSFCFFLVSPGGFPNWLRSSFKAAARSNGAEPSVKRLWAIVASDLKGGAVDRGNSQGVDKGDKKKGYGM
jgi:hypothetical protein